MGNVFGKSDRDGRNSVGAPRQAELDAKIRSILDGQRSAPRSMRGEAGVVDGRLSETLKALAALESRRRSAEEQIDRLESRLAALESSLSVAEATGNAVDGVLSRSLQLEGRLGRLERHLFGRQALVRPGSPAVSGQIPVAAGWQTSSTY